LSGEGGGTDLFLALTPERVLAAVETAGVRCRPVCYPLNSFENRVYEVELEDRSRVIAKFYRPQRWTREQILEEHAFLGDLAAAEIPVCPPRAFPDGSTLHRTGAIWYALFERLGGRAPDELDDALAERLGRLVGRLHNVGAARPARHRLRFGADVFVRDSLKWLATWGGVPAHLWGRYAAAAGEIAQVYDDWSAGVAVHRVHGDLHLGNLLLRDGLLRVVDFDDMAVGPAVQDLWLALPGRDEETLLRRERFLAGYEQFRELDRRSLRLIEPLRGLRLVHYAAWLGRRWHDPIFPRAFPHFGSDDYWERETLGLEEIVGLLRGGETDETGRPAHGETAAAREPEPELSNADFFWDWQETPNPRREPS